MVLAWFRITSSWNTACYIRGLIHGIGRGVPNVKIIAWVSHFVYVKPFLVRRSKEFMENISVCQILFDRHLNIVNVKQMTNFFLSSVV